jgi:hypothetical protein
MDVDVPLRVRGALRPDDESSRVTGGSVYAVGLHRTGPESDRVLHALARLYAMPVPPSGRMRQSLSFTALAVHEDTGAELEGPIRFKLFANDGEPFDEARYCESFLNVDLENGVVGWNEKDNDYRGPLLTTLAAEASSRHAAPRRRVGLALALCAMLPATCAMSALEDHLLKSGALNKRDLPPIGNDEGTLGDYLLNVWMWDGAIFLSILVALPAFAIGVWLLVRGPRASLRGADDERAQSAAPR